MATTIRKTAYLASTALGLSLLSYSAQANPSLPNLTNLDFTSYSGSAPKDAFTSVNPDGWTGGTGLIAIDSPTAGNQAADAKNGQIQTYGNPTGSVPGNYVQADGNPNSKAVSTTP